jgi:hypothetical protein
VLDSIPVLAWTAANTCRDRALTWLVVTLPATPNQICRRKSILLAWLVTRAWPNFETVRQMGIRQFGVSNCDAFR